MALGGTAFATATVGSRDVVNDSLKSKDLKNGAGVKGIDVVDDSLNSSDIDEDSLGPAGTVFTSHLVDIGGDGTVFGSPSGIGSVQGSVTGVQQTLSFGALVNPHIRGLQVFLPEGALTGGQTRIFTVVDGFNGAPSDSTLECGMSGGGIDTQLCVDSDDVAVTSDGALAIKVVSTGNPVATADAAVSFRLVSAP